MKKIGHNCEKSEWLCESNLNMQEVLGNNKIMITELKKGSLDTVMTLGDDLCTGPLLGRKFPLSSLIRKFHSKVAEITGRSDMYDYQIYEEEGGSIVIVADTDFSFRYKNGVITDRSGDRYDSLVDSFHDVMDYFNGFKIPLRSIFICANSIETLNRKDLNEVKNCYMGWCSCHKNSELASYWMDVHKPKEYLMAIFI